MDKIWLAQEAMGLLRFYCLFHLPAAVHLHFSQMRHQMKEGYTVIKGKFFNAEKEVNLMTTFDHLNYYHFFRQR